MFKSIAIIISEAQLVPFFDQWEPLQVTFQILITCLLLRYNNMFQDYFEHFLPQTWNQSFFQEALVPLREK